MRKSNHKERWFLTASIGLILSSAVLPLYYAQKVHAEADNREFTIQVSPSPLSVTLTPGKRLTTVLNVRNLSNHSETLVPSLRGFHFDPKTKKIALDTEAPTAIKDWVHFKQATLTLAAGSAQTLEIIYDTPQHAGFSYASAVLLSRAGETAPISGANVKGSVAVFNLINIDRPDAKRELTIDRLATDRGTYEFLPSTFTTTIKNNGNVIDQPRGTIFIQRSFDDQTPIATLPINSANGYVLPGTTRTFTTQWSDGFPAYRTTTNPKNGKSERRLSWDWKQMSKLRFGRYVAKTVVVYNDGVRDIPLVQSTTFWVIPWRIIIVTVVIILVLCMGLFTWGRLIASGTKKVQHYARRR